MESQHNIAAGRIWKFFVSPRLAQLKQEFLDGGGRFALFHVLDFFVPLQGKHKLSKLDFSFDGKTPVYSSDTSNNGISGYTNLAPEFIVDESNPVYVVFGDHTRTLNLATSDFCIADNVKVLKPKINDINILLYINTSWRKAIPNLGYARHWSVAKSCEITLPKTVWNYPDFDFMRRYIATLKAERVATLKAYLQAAGLSDTILTEGELAALDALRKNRIKWRDTPVCGEDGAFIVNNTHCILKAQVVPGSGNIPYVGAGETNNSVQSYISFDPTQIERGNSIMIGGKTLVITYQEKDYFSNDSHNLALYYKDVTNPSRNIQLFLVSSLYRSLKPKYHWGDSISNSKIKGDTLMLPITTDGKIDYELMTNLISAQTKLCISDILKSKDIEITATESIISDN